MTQLDPQAFCKQLKDCVAPSNEARCLPPQAYASNCVVELEREKLFQKGWLPIGRSDRVKNPGDFETFDLAGHPIIILRDKEGKLQAFANTCRHRGARLLDGQGNISGIRCPFHAWLYRLDGSLAAAPHMEEAKNFELCDHGLVSYPLAEAFGFAFVSLQENPPAIEHWLGNFGQIHTGWPIESLVQTFSWTRQYDCNWKCFIDVFNEYYHLPYVHKDSIDSVYERPEPGEETTGKFASQFGKTVGTGGLLENQREFELPDMPGLEGRALNGVIYTWLFPFMTFALSNDAMWVYLVQPIKGDRCEVTLSACFHPETINLAEFAQKSEQYYVRLETALAEDIPALENQQAGLSSPRAIPGPFASALEPNVAGFAKWYASEMLEHIGADQVI